VTFWLTSAAMTAMLRSQSVRAVLCQPVPPAAWNASRPERSHLGLGGWQSHYSFIMGFLLAAILSGVIGVLLGVLMEDRLSLLLSEVAGQLNRGSRGLRGDWKYQWTLDAGTSPSATSRPPSPETELRFRQLGHRIWARASDTRADHAIRLAGRLDGRNLITGTWSREQPHSAKGAFQLYWHPSGDKLSGSWVGIDSENSVNMGKWSIVRVS
jgi:hypothetical protein